MNSTLHIVQAPIIEKAFVKKNGVKTDQKELYLLPLEVSFRRGEWDRCGEAVVQSRVGDYVIIYRIVEQ